MKYNNLSLGLSLGVALGLLVGFCLGRGSSSFDGGHGHESTRNIEGSLPGDPLPENAEIVASPINDWLRHYAYQFERPIENRPTPGLADAIGDALKAAEPFDQSRMLLLIEMMRKEDFPVALQILRQARTPINFKSVNSGGPPMWVAFWQRFGEVDPQTALTKALECHDLEYAERKFLEKNVFEGMARANPSAAAAAFMAHPELPNRTIAAQGLIVAWARTDPAAACGWANQNLRGEDLNSAYYAAAWAIGEGQDMARSKTFLQSVPVGPTRDNALRAMKSQISARPYFPLHHILEFITTSRELGARDRGFESKIAIRCAKTDPLAAANFFSQPLAEDQQNDYRELRVVTSEWVRKDPKSAEAWAKDRERMPYYMMVAQELARAADERGDQSAAEHWISILPPVTNAGQ